MARINIEDSVWADPRFNALTNILGSREIAIGVLICAWYSAQSFFKTNKVGIPSPIFRHLSGAQALVDSGFAELREDFVYMRGSMECFGWLIEAKNNGAKGGRTRTKNNAHGKPPSSEIIEEFAKPIQGSYSSSSSSSSSKNKTKNKAKTKSSSEVVSPSLGSQIWEAYRDAYFQRYQTDPIRNATTNSQAANLGKRLGEQAIEVVRFYLKHNDGHYLRNQHPIGLCLAQAEGIHTQWKRNRAVTSVQVKQFENASHFDDLRDMVDRGEL